MFLLLKLSHFLTSKLLICAGTIFTLHKIMKIKNKILLLIFIVVATVACDEPPIEKPEHLIQHDKMINMMVDIHLAESAYLNRRSQDSLVRESSSADFYYSVLNEYQIPDSVFEKSFVYYASTPKKFEKMYRDVMNKLNEMDQEYSGRQNDLLDFGTEK